MKSRGRVTSADVAALADVSQSAVSRAFTPGASVAPDTRERVLRAARSLGYRPNAIARSLISGRSRIIGLLASHIDNPFYALVLERLARALQDRGYHTLLFVTDPGDEDPQLEKLLAFQVDGVVMASAPLSSRLARECHDASIPVVCVNREVPASEASSVVSDNEAGGRLVADHFVDSGFQRIAYLAGDVDSSTNSERERGFIAGLAARERSVHARVIGNYSPEEAAAVTRDLMKSAEPPDAIFAANDMMAFSVLDTLRGELGLCVPDDVAVVGFDDVPQSAWSAYSLSSVRQPADALIASTVDILFAQIDDRDVPRRRVCLPVELVVRSSSARPV